MLYIMRHGKTDWNTEYRLQGRTDIPLNADGIRMAEQARDRYLDVHFDICFCSPLTRAQQTAALMLKGRDIPVVTDDRLMEMGFGAYEGTDHVLDRKIPGLSELFSDPENYHAGNGAESFEELYARTGDFLKNTALPLVNAGKDVLIIGHGAMNSSIVCQIRNVPLSGFWSAGIPNCELIKLI